MPVYVYKVIREDGEPGEQFEIRQSIHDKALTHHPDTGEPIKRVIQPAFVAGSHSQMAIDKKLKDPKKLEQMFLCQGQQYLKKIKVIWEKI